MTLRTRLAMTYGIGLAIGLIVFAMLSIVTIDRTLRTGLDDRLTTAAQAAAAVAAVDGNEVAVGGDDRRQLASIFPAAISGAIVDARGRVVFQSGKSVASGIVSALRSLVGTRSFDAGSGSNAVRVVGVPLRDLNRGTIVGAAFAWADDAWIGDFDRSAIAASTAVAITILALALLFSGWLAGRALAPLRRLSALAADIEARDLSRRLDETGFDELARLCEAFNRMLDRLEEAFKRQQRFTADASHEFRAPMSVIRAEADLALRRERSAREYRRALEVIATEADRMEGLVEALLDAARADEGSGSREALDLLPFAQQIAMRFEPSARAKTIALHVVGVGRPIVNANADALSRALTAIVHNAILWTPATSQVDIVVAGDRRAATIVVKDDGPGFTPEALERATERFWRGDPARRAGSSGLGLAIARALVEGSGGSLTLANGPRAGALVTIAFPA
ncbi:MAG TPA: ATP-binding protein [Candidatus Baltobacteraceae bacterium]